MPKVRPLTEAARRAEAEQTQRQRVVRIIAAASEALGYDRQKLADLSGLDVQALNRRMRCAADFKVPELCRISDVLSLDGQSRAALCGAKEKSRYEPGYRVGASGA